MRYLSRLFQPVVVIPKNAQVKNTDITCKSQKLLLECGLIRPTSSGLFTILPLARRAIDKLEAQIISCIEAVGAQRISLPSLTATNLWKKTGRLDDMGTELMQLKDRHGKDYLLAPTYEESVADLLADVGPLSYKQLPLLLYQISNKYRDEHRPKHGLLRAREFAMLDAYGAHADAESARDEYERVTRAYGELFARLDLPVRRVPAPVGDMGGSVSHEWQLPAPAGEDRLAVCGGCGHASVGDGGPCETCGAETRATNSIEVGHTFVLGARYSEPLSARYAAASGAPQPLHMTCYGIGITRLLAASVEALSSDTSLRWPRLIAPYTALVIGPKDGSREWAAHGWDRTREVCAVAAQALGAADEVLADDRHHLTVGRRLMMADRTGYPYIIVCGKSVLQSPARYEVYRGDLPPQLVTLQQLPVVLQGDQGASEAEIHN